MDATRIEAAAHIAAILKANREINSLKAKIAHHRGRLNGSVAEAFSRDSYPIDGVTLEPREISLIGYDTPCDVSPIGVCAYSDRVMSIPGQRGRREATRTDACLFCGRLRAVG